MPSGAKKRKAAKKKKENQDQLNNPSDPAAVHAHPHEIGEDSKVKYPSSVEGSRIEKEIKIEDELGRNDGIINSNEEIKKSCDGDSSRSSSNITSDDESHGIKNDQDESTEGPLEGSESLSGKTDQKESVTEENDDRDGAQHMKDTVLAEPLVSPSPYPIQKTSWKGCCGLFEVFSASSA